MADDPEMRGADSSSMVTRDWSGAGSSFELEWGGRTWILDLSSRNPGLRDRDGGIGPLLALTGLAEVHRWEPEALSGDSLVGVERRHGRVEATYAPVDWNDLFVRAAWSPWGESGVNLEVQVHTLSVGQLRSVEVMIRSCRGVPRGGDRSSPILRVEPRDARAAALSYDGREPDLGGLSTNPVHERDRAPRPPNPGLESSGLDLRYVELVHPQDVTRTIREEGAEACRYGLFGYDLEKGIVLRARLRGLWLPAESADAEAAAHFGRFLLEPPPLAT